MKVTILGCGSSGGVPMITGTWGACDSHNPKNRRRRASILVEHKGIRVLVDTSPDLREQLLSAGSPRLDAVLLTHDHFDHIGGLDDLRPFYFGTDKTVSLYTNEAVYQRLSQRFPYLFQDASRQPSIYRPYIVPHVITQEPFFLEGLEVRPFNQDHGFSGSLGFRFKDVAYSTDIKNMTDEARAHLCDLDVWIVDCLSYDVRPTHSHLAQTLSWIEELRPKRAYLTHMDHSLDYDTLCRQLPDNVRPCYDGLVIEEDEECA